MVKNFIFVVPGSAFGAEGFYRLSFCKNPEDIKRGMEQFEKVYDKVIEELKNRKDENNEKDQDEGKRKFPESNNIINC